MLDPEVSSVLSSQPMLEEIIAEVELAPVSLAGEVDLGISNRGAARGVSCDALVQHGEVRDQSPASVLFGDKEAW